MRNPRTRKVGSMSRAQALARGLGWFSIALGAVELLAPRQVAAGGGLPGRRGLVRAYGLRELATGVGLLASADPRPWIWGRIAGDALDLATLAPGLSQENPRRAAARTAFGAVAAVTVLDVACARELEQARAAQRPSGPPPDYSDRSGFPRPPSEMRGKARHLVASG